NATKSGVSESWPEKPRSGETDSSGAGEETSVTDDPHFGRRPAPVSVASFPFPALVGDRSEQNGFELCGEIVDRVGNHPDRPPFEGVRRDTVDEIHRGHDSARVFGGADPRHEMSFAVEDGGVDLCPARTPLHVLLPLYANASWSQMPVCRL